MLKELKRMTCQVDNVEKAREWYSSLLQAEPAFDSPVVSIFRIGNSTLSLVQGPAPLPPDSGRLAVYWEVDDVDQAFARLLELGASAKVQPANVLSIRTAQVIDPFGNALGLTGSIPQDKNRTIENQPSETAHAVALCRALASRELRPEIRRPDPFSELFLRDEVKPALQEESHRQAIVNRRVSRPLYGYLLARSAFLDDLFLRSLQDKVPQIVLLGAGYDTRTLRFAQQLGGTQVYELDAPSTQQRKISVLSAAQVPLPAQLHFLSVNFKNEDFAQKLTEAGFDPSLRTLFLWEGVTYYLPQSAVDQTLERVRTISTPGTGLGFDYMTTKLESVNAGEPFLSWKDPEALPSYVAQYGFRLVEHLDANQMAERYLVLGDGTLAEKPLSTLRLAYAQR